VDRPEQAAAVAYLKRKGTEASAARLQAGLKATFRQFEQALDRVPEAVRSRRLSTSAWSIHEIGDHLVESHRPAVMELRDLCAGISEAARESNRRVRRRRRANRRGVQQLRRR